MTSPPSIPSRRAPSGRGLETVPGPVHKFAQTAGLEVRTPLSLKGPDEQAAFAALDLDAAVVVAYGLLLPKAILEAPKLGCFNLHGSLLPRWRGAAPIQRAVMAGDLETGVMVMHMDEGLDTGPVLMAERVTIGRKTIGRTQRPAFAAGRRFDGAGAGRAGTRPGQPSNRKRRTASPMPRKLQRIEARIDWCKARHEIDCLIRGLSPSPGAFTEVKGERLKILLAEPAAGSGAPGERRVGDDLTIACGEGALRLLKSSAPAARRWTAADLLKGFALPRGSVLSDDPLPPRRRI